MKHPAAFPVLPSALALATLVSLAFLQNPSRAGAHEGHSEAVPPPGMEREILRKRLLEEWESRHHPPATSRQADLPVLVGSIEGGASLLRLISTGAASAARASAPWQAATFQKFPKLQLRWDSDYLYIGSNGLPDHQMMVGITNWQQQVPLPQAYFGDNTWRLPLHPVPAKTPASIKNRFLRGAIAIAVNGIPIFNPQNNRGEVSQEIGELDQWGGHCGRADDYHYHAAPLHLQAVVGKGLPIAYALDGYPIYGITEPDGSLPAGLDAFHGHETKELGYHYHASTNYPYLNGGFHGEVTEAENQVDPQPRARPLRPATGPLRGAKIIGFESAADFKSQSLKYTVNGREGAVNYAQLTDGAWKFQLVSTDGQTEEQTYHPGGGPKGGPRPHVGAERPDDANRPPPSGDNAPSSPVPPAATSAKVAGAFVLSSTEVANGGELPVDYTGDGSGATPPLQWSGAPSGAKSYALVMHHLDPEGKTKWYWIVYNIPPEVQALPKNVQGVGIVGTGFKGHIGYEPPHSKGPGPKTYVLSLYALSAPADVKVPPSQVSYEVIMEAMKGKILASADLSVVHTSSGNSGPPEGGQRPRRPGNGGNGPPTGEPPPRN